MTGYHRTKFAEMAVYNWLKPPGSPTRRFSRLSGNFLSVRINLRIATYLRLSLSGRKQQISVNPDRAEMVSLVSLFDIAMCFGHLFQWIAPIDHRF